EDGIRDFHVTGVQTCALPILSRPDFVLDTRVNLTVLPTLGFDENEYASEVLMVGAGEGRDAVTAHVPTTPSRLRRVAIVTDKSQIGRASCRARGEMVELRVII